MKPVAPTPGSGAVAVVALIVLASACAGHPHGTIAKRAPELLAGAAIGKTSDAVWTRTTVESATADAHQRVLESGRADSVTGEIVDVSCYLQLGKRGPDHVSCGTRCIQNGQPIGIVDRDNVLTILFAEEHHPRRDGEVQIRSIFLPYLAKTVTVRGVRTEVGGVRGMFVQAALLGGKVAQPGLLVPPKRIEEDVQPPGVTPGDSGETP